MYTIKGRNGVVILRHFATLARAVDYCRNLSKGGDDFDVYNPAGKRCWITPDGVEYLIDTQEH